MTPKKLKTPRGKFNQSTVLKYLQTHGKAKTRELQIAMGAEAPSLGTLSAAMSKLAKKGIVANHEKFGMPAIWYLAGQMPEPITQPEPEPEPEPEQEVVEHETDKPPYYDSQIGEFIGPRFCPPGIVPPPQAPSFERWTPPKMVCIRPGVPQKLKDELPSRVGGKRVKYKASYSAALSTSKK